MLRFPLPPVPDPSLHIDRLNPEIHRQLCTLMDCQEGLCWKILSFAMSKMKQEGSVAHQTNYTSAQLFATLGKWMCTVEVLAYFLENCHMHEPLYLLKERIPMRIIEEIPREVVGRIHQKLELAIEVTGFPKPTFQWFLNDSILESSTSNPLVILDFSNSDAGTYKCEITQQCRDGYLHKIHSQLSTVTMENFAPCVTKHPLDSQLKAGSILELSCSIEGHPTPDFQWYKDDFPIPSAVTPLLEITCTSIHDSGLYKCFATNSEGKTVTKEAFVKVEANSQDSWWACGQPWPQNGGHRHTASMKQALLIGNWTYEGHGLKKVRADVKTLHDILYGMGFEVISLCNLGKVEILNATDRFCELLLPDAYVVVYFAGHGIHYYNDYLMPADLQINSDYSVRDLVDGNEIIARIQQRDPKLLVVLLDMCRTIPIEGRNPRIRGEMPKEVPRDSRSNLVMAWATSENSYAYEMGHEENGIFMTYLKREMESGQNLSVTGMLERLKHQSKLDIPIQASDQRPVTFSSLAEPLSLYDPVNPAVIGDSDWNNCRMLASTWRELPPKQEAIIHVNGNMIVAHIEFNLMDGCFSNGLRIKVVTEGSERVTFQPTIHPPILELLELKHELDSNSNWKCTVTIQNLQALQEDANLFLTVTQVPSETITISLGQPLIAKARIASNHF